jgi:hypothetical protein
MPFLLKKDTKYKHTRVSYFSDSVWTTIYSDENKKEDSKLFWIIVSYRHSLDDNGRKSYRSKFAGYPATSFKDKWAWILLKGDIEIKISASNKSVQTDKAMEEVLKEFDIKAIESVFDAKSKYPKLKEYLLKIKAINEKITAVNDKFKEKEKEAVEALKPFIGNEEGILKGFDLSSINFTTSNTFSIYVKQDRKSLLTLNVGRPGALGLLSYFNNKNLVKSKIGSFETTTLKDNLAIIKLPTIAVKASTYFQSEFKNAEKLKAAAASLDLEGLSKVK